jgi:hypothetical protein
MVVLKVVFHLSLCVEVLNGPSGDHVYDSPDGWVREVFFLIRLL